MQLARQQSPEDRELESKRTILAALESNLTARELDLATLHAALLTFEKKYLLIVGKRYAELDDLLAQIAETQARLHPQDQAANQSAAESRQQANESAHAAAAINDSPLPANFQPSDSLKKLYRQAAKALHPDLANSEEDRARRTAFMARANQAYEANDESALQAILQEWHSSPESILGTDIASELIRTIRKIARIEDRLRAIAAEITALQQSSLHTLKTKSDEAASQNRDLLAEMASDLVNEISAARNRLNQLLRGRRYE